jgi:hypothetical protein
VIRSLAPTRAFAAVLSHAHCFDGTDPEETQRLIADYLAIVERVPVYDLQYRSGFEHLAQVVDSIVRLSGSASANRRFTASQTVPVP